MAFTPRTAEAVNLRQRVAALHRTSEGQSSLAASGLSDSSHAHDEGRVFPSWLAEQISSLDGNSSNSSAGGASASSGGGGGGGRGGGGGTSNISSGTRDAANIVSFSPPPSYPVPKHRPRDESIFSRPLFPQREIFPESPPVTTTPFVDTAAATTTNEVANSTPQIADISPLLPQDTATSPPQGASATSAPGSPTTKVLNDATATSAPPAHAHGSAQTTSAVQENAAQTGITQPASSSEPGANSTPVMKGSASGTPPLTDSLLSIAESNATTEQETVATEGVASDPSATSEQEVTTELAATTELATTTEEENGAGSTTESAGSSVQTTEGMVVPEMVKPSEVHSDVGTGVVHSSASQATIVAAPASLALASAHFITPESDHTQVVHPVFVASKGNVDDSEDLEAKLQQLQV